MLAFPYCIACFATLDCGWTSSREVMWRLVRVFTGRLTQLIEDLSKRGADTSRLLLPAQTDDAVDFHGV